MSLPNPITRTDHYLNKIADPTYDGEMPNPISRIDHYLDAIAENAGGSDLPEVTGDDNGDILAVSSGTWGKSDTLKPLMGVDVANTGQIPIVSGAGTWSLTDYPANELPTVTASDNGSVLMVVNGAWGLGQVAASPIPIAASNTVMNINAGGSL